MGDPAASRDHPCTGWTSGRDGCTAGSRRKTGTGVTKDPRGALAVERAGLWLTDHEEEQILVCSWPSSLLPPQAGLIK